MILITGASAGIGEACAIKLGSLQHDLFLVARRVDRLESLKSKILKTNPNVKIVIDQLDVSDHVAVEEFSASQKENLKNVSVLINNAGLAKGLSTVQEGNFDDWNQVIDTNVKGLLDMTRIVLPHMIKKSDGFIVNIGSIAGRWVYPKGNVYNASKFAVHAINEALRLDLHGTGIRVSEICPGMVETEFSEVRFNQDHEKAKAVYAGMKPLSPMDIAETVAWVLGQPKHVNVQEVVIFPTDQSAVSLVNRKG